MSRRIDAALIDFGGVFTASPFAAVEEFGAELGADPGRVLGLIFGPYDRDTQHPWHRLERGEIELVQAREEIIALGAEQGLDTDPFQVFSRLGASGGARMEVIECVRRVRAAGVRTACVTNNLKEFRAAWTRMLPVSELFDTIVDSSEVGMRKPNPRIYQHALEALGGVAPERAVFLDDYEGNVAAAARLGIHGILVGADPSPAMAELESLVGAA